METISATRRATRSQIHSKKIEEYEMNAPKSRQKTERKQKDKQALVDITNDSPIIGLAKKSVFGTPSSKKRVNSKIKIGTPGSGEALLRDQVRTLLEKVEEDAEFSKISQEIRPFHHLTGLRKSPINILAPTPANTPQVLNLPDTEIVELASVTPSLVEGKLMGNEIFEGKKDFVTRSLLFDFIEKLDGCDSSEDRKERIFSDDDESVWSIQVNVSSSTKDEFEDYEDGIEKSVEKANEDGECEDVMNELCEGLSKINMMTEETREVGKHTRFVYDSDGELVEVQEEIALHLIGFKNWQGKHIRFHDEEYYSDVE